MLLRRFAFVILACLALGPPAFSQSKAGPFVISSSTSKCATIGTQGQATVFIDVTGTFSITLNPEVAIEGGAARGAQVFPTNSSTAQTTITAAGGYYAPVGSADEFLVCVGSYVSGSATILLTATPAVNASILSGGGGGGSMVYPGAGIPNSTGSAWGTSYTSFGSEAGVPTSADPGTTAEVPMVADGTHGQKPSASGALKSGAFANSPLLVSASYTFNVNGTTVNAVNNATGAVDYTGTDATVVVNAAIANNASVCGNLTFGPGVYNVNSLINETAAGYTSYYYAFGIPGQAGTNQLCKWTVTASSPPTLLDQFGTPVQTSGTIFNITSTAVSSVSSSAVIVGWWSRISASVTAEPVGNWVEYKNFDVRFPSNQRSTGAEEAIDCSIAVSCFVNGVIVDTAVAQASLQVPLANMYGFVTTLPQHEQNVFENNYCMGYYVCYDVQTDHFVGVNNWVNDADYAFNIGVRGTNATPSVISFTGGGWGETIHGLTFGSNLLANSIFDWSGLMIEDSYASGFLPAFAPVYHGKETNAGYAMGRVSYEVNLSGPSVANVPVSIFDGGGGANFQLCASGYPCNAAASSASASTLCVQQTCQDYDIFTGTSGTAVTSHASGGGQSWAVYTANSSGGYTLKLNGVGAVTITGAGTNEYAAVLNSLTPATANYKVSSTCTTLVAAGYACTLYARTPSTSTQGYVFQCRYDRGGCVMFNATTQIGSTYTYSGFSTNGNSHIMTLGVNGTAITGYIDGLPVVTATDVTVAGAGQAGFQLGGTPSTGTPSSSMSNWLVQ